MESSENTTQLLKNKWKLDESKEVKKAAEVTRRHTGEWPKRDPLSRIQNYLDRLDNLINPTPLEGHPNFDRKERNLEMLKVRLHDRYVVKPDEIPEGFWENQRRIIRERGQGGDLAQVDFDELKRQNTEAIIADQTSSLDKWADYFFSSDSSWVPDSLKYYTFRSVLDMAEYDKEKKEYPKRSKGTTKPFPDLNREALEYVLDAVNKKYQQTQQERKAEEQQRKAAGRELTDIEKLLEGENFAKLYAYAIEKVTPASPEQLAATSGQWVKYDHRSDHMPLVQSLQGHGTGWCTAGESTAQKQLQGGDFYVYYSLDQDGKPTIPRVAIRMEENKIAEIRGIAADQNLDSGAAQIVDEKLKEFGTEGQSYKKRAHDMEFLTIIDHKTQENQPLTGQELAFLYEIDSPIEGFGYSKDPRITEVRSKRNVDEDMLVVFNCDRNQIAHNMRELRPNKKAYVGKLESGIFDQIVRYNIEQVYTSFPEGKIRLQTDEIGGKNREQLKQELAQLEQTNLLWVSTWAKSMIDNPKFTTRTTPDDIQTVRLTVQDLGFDRGTPTTDQIYKKAAELGLELCPAELGVHRRLKNLNQPEEDWYYIGMKPITASDGSPDVFALVRYGGRLGLDERWAGPGREWGLGSRFVFGLRKPSPQNLSLLGRIFKG